MNWIGFLTYALITAFTPGPNNIMSLSIAGRLGMKRAFPFSLGVMAGFSVLILLCTALGSTLNSVLPAIKTPMLFVGAAYMLYLAWKIFRSTGIHEQSTLKTGFWTAFLLQFINPKGIVYAIVSLETFILPYYHGQTAVLIALGLMLAFFGFVSTLCWAAFGSVFKLLFSKYAKTTNVVMALLLVYCAVSLFL
jgi:threonine/homoserine/homoserine lactone efflux protein